MNNTQLSKAGSGAVVEAWHSSKCRISIYVYLYVYLYIDTHFYVHLSLSLYIYISQICIIVGGQYSKGYGPHESDEDSVSTKARPGSKALGSSTEAARLPEASDVARNETKNNSSNNNSSRDDSKYSDMYILVFLWSVYICIYIYICRMSSEYHSRSNLQGPKELPHTPQVR